MKTRKLDSRLELVVIDDFIKARLLSEFPEHVSDACIHVIHHPVQPIGNIPAVEVPELRVCFIGYRTRHKGYELFERLGQGAVGISLLCIGGGMVETVPDGPKWVIKGNDDYLNEISTCAVAVFPYTGGYYCSLSAAALDALSAGVHIVATRRPCFEGLARYFGDEVVTLVGNEAELEKLCSDNVKLSSWKVGKVERLSRLAESRYGLKAVGSDFERAIGKGGYILSECA